MLIRSDASFAFPGISYSVILTVTIASAAFFLFVIGMGIRAQRARPVTGSEGLLHETGTAMETLDPSGNVMIHGELWHAESVSGKIEVGSLVKVTSRNKFTLYVELMKNI